jgi:hypothetical protein
MNIRFAFSRHLLCIACLLYSGVVLAQSSNRLFLSGKKINAGQKGELRFELDNINFFKNNEFSSEIIEGYTLPGFRILPKVTYHFLPELRMELGLHALLFHGAERYPMMGYRDIAVWKDDKYVYGFHLMPWLRAHLALSDHADLVLGSIYGGANHRLIEPLYAPELNLTADPETGLQLLLDYPFLDVDAWVNWQSFIYKGDTHQEEFIAGLSSRIRLNSPASRFHLYLPVQGLAQHRGGEIDTLLTSSVQTLMNGAAGLGVTWNNPAGGLLQSVGLEVHAAGYYQQAGELWPLESGHGLHIQADANLKDFYLKAGYWESFGFISILGLPYYGSVSTKTEGVLFDHPMLLTLNAEYTRPLGGAATLGIGANVYHRLPDRMLPPGTGWAAVSSETGFTVGIALRATPSFLLKKFE